MVTAWSRKGLYFDIQVKRLKPECACLNDSTSRREISGGASATSPIISGRRGAPPSRREETLHLELLMRIWVLVGASSGRKTQVNAGKRKLAFAAKTQLDPRNWELGKNRIRLTASAWSARSPTTEWRQMRVQSRRQSSRIGKPHFLLYVRNSTLSRLNNATAAATARAA
jgi:hypothetical protein